MVLLTSVPQVQQYPLDCIVLHSWPLCPGCTLLSQVQQYTPQLRCATFLVAQSRLRSVTTGVAIFSLISMCYIPSHTVPATQCNHRCSNILFYCNVLHSWPLYPGCTVLPQVQQYISQPRFATFLATQSRLCSVTRCVAISPLIAICYITSHTVSGLDHDSIVTYFHWGKHVRDIGWIIRGLFTNIAPFI